MWRGWVVCDVLFWWGVSWCGWLGLLVSWTVGVWLGSGCSGFWWNVVVGCRSRWILCFHCVQWVLGSCGAWVGVQGCVLWWDPWGVVIGGCAWRGLCGGRRARGVKGWETKKCGYWWGGCGVDRWVPVVRRVRQSLRRRGEGCSPGGLPGRCGTGVIRGWWLGCGAPSVDVESLGPVVGPLWVC